jgi:hypothetical protein
MSSLKAKSGKHTALVAVTLGLSLAANAALACNTGCAPPVPPSPPSHPNPPSSGSGSHSSSTATATATATARATSSSTVIYGGGYSNWSQTPGTPQTMPLNVVTEAPAPVLAPAPVRIVETTRTEKVVQKKVVAKRKVVKKKKVIACATPVKVVKPAPKPVIRRVAVVKKPVVVQQQQATRTVVERTVVYEGNAYQSSGYMAQSAYGQSGYAQSLIYRATALQAVCMDDRSAPRAAAQVQGQRELDGGYAGEVYRCAPSERLVATLAAFEGNQASLNGGRSLSCHKGEALWYERGGLFCRPAIAASAGFEDDLLRRYGTGIKVVSIAYTQVQSGVQRSEAASGCNCINAGSLTTMVFDGGVGGFVQ